MGIKFFRAFVFVQLLLGAVLFSAKAQDTIPRAGLRLWITADSVQMTGTEVAKIYDLSGSNNSPTHSTDVPNITTVPSIVKVGNKYYGHAVLHFPGSFTGFNFNTITGIRAVFAVLLKDSTSCNLNETPGCCWDQSAKFWLGATDGSTNFHADHGCCIFRNDLSEVSPCVAGPAAFVSINGGPKIANPMITYMPFHLGLLTILATCGVEANAIARDRSMTDRSYQGDIAEILIYNTVLDTPTVKKIQTILGTKYGLPGFATSTSPSPVSSVRTTVSPVSIIYANGTSVNIKIADSGRYSLKIFNTKGQIALERTGIAPDVVTFGNEQLPGGYYCISATVNNIEARFSFVNASVR
jgi:hypothetical protein